MKETRNVERTRSAEGLRALDFGGFAQALERFNADEVEGRGADGALWRAEVLLYLDRLEEATSVLDELGAGGGSPESVNDARARLVRCEIAYFEGRFEDAERDARDVLASDAASAEPTLIGRGWYDLGRVLRRRMEFMVALEHLLIARQYAREVGNAFLEGLVAYNRAICLYELGHEAAEGAYREALELLTRSENLRYKAIAESSFGLLLSDLGRVDEALRLFEAAERSAADLGIASDMLTSGNNHARALLLLGRYDETVRRTRELLRWERDTRYGYAEMIAYQLQSHAAYAMGDFALAAESAEAATRLGELGGSPSDVLDGQLLLARARARGGDPEPLAVLRQLRELADVSGTGHQRVEARIYLAEALVTTSPVEAQAILDEARTLPLLARNPRFLAELERVARLVETAPIRVEPEGIFQVDVRTQWPSLKTAREALERFLITKAVESTHGNLAAAGRLLGETRFQMHYLWKMMHDAPPRPALSASAAAKGRKRRPRNLFSERRK